MFSLSQQAGCIKPTSSSEYKDFINDWAIKPHTKKKMKIIGSYIISIGIDTLYIDVFNRIDVDTMSCKEFKEKMPIKKVWALTQKDAEALDWTVTYP